MTPSELESDAHEYDKVREQKMRRLTPGATAFIIKYVNMGYPNQTINQLLRHYGYLEPGSLDLSTDCLTRVRGLKECQRDPTLLTKEAQETIHKSLSQIAVDYAHLRVLCQARLSGVDVGGHGLIYGKDTTVSEVRSVMADAVKYLTWWESKNIPNAGVSVGDDTKSVGSDDSSQLDAMERLVSAVLTQRLNQATKRLEAAGVVVPPEMMADAEEKGITDSN